MRAAGQARAGWLRAAVCAVVVAGVPACGDDAGDGDSMQTGSGVVSFAQDVHPILLQKCAGSGCHSVATSLPGHAAPDVDAAYAATQGFTVTGAPVYEAILARTSAMGPTSMPPPYAIPPCEGALGAPGCLTVAEFELIQEWVEQGMPR